MQYLCILEWVNRDVHCKGHFKRRFHAGYMENSCKLHHKLGFGDPGVLPIVRDEVSKIPERYKPPPIRSNSPDTPIDYNEPSNWSDAQTAGYIAGMGALIYGPAAVGATQAYKAFYGSGAYQAPEAIELEAMDGSYAVTTYDGAAAVAANAEASAMGASADVAADGFLTADLVAVGETASSIEMTALAGESVAVAAETVSIGAEILTAVETFAEIAALAILL